jgi:hypothetical protein
MCLRMFVRVTLVRACVWSQDIFRVTKSVANGVTVVTFTQTDGRGLGQVLNFTMGCPPIVPDNNGVCPSGLSLQCPRPAVVLVPALTTMSIFGFNATTAGPASGQYVSSVNKAAAKLTIQGTCRKFQVVNARTSTYSYIHGINEARFV